MWKRCKGNPITSLEESISRLSSANYTKLLPFIFWDLFTFHSSYVAGRGSCMQYTLFPEFHSPTRACFRAALSRRVADVSSIPFQPPSLPRPPFLTAAAPARAASSPTRPTGGCAARRRPQLSFEELAFAFAAPPLSLSLSLSPLYAAVG